MWIYSNDNITIEQRRRELPAKHWEVTGPNEGRYHDLDPANAATFGWSELVEVARPDPDHVKTVEHDGTAWVEVWAHDADLAAANSAAVLDETDSGLDIDALRIVSEGVNSLRSPDRAYVVITHYQRLLDYIVPDFVHVLVDGKIVESGDKSLALKLEEHGYDWLKEDDTNPDVATAPAHIDR